MKGNKEIMQHSSIVPVPLFKLVRDRILLDLYQTPKPEGAFYATEKQLCDKYQVSRNTVRHALGELEKNGYLSCRQKVGVIVTDKGLLNRTIVPDQKKVILLLPVWNYNSGNFYDHIVMRELNSAMPPYHPYNVEMRLYHEFLPEEADDLFAVIAVDPLFQQLPALERLHKRGVKIITVEPQSNFYMAANLQFDIIKAAFDAISLLFRQGHRRIGLVKQPGIHVTFDQWFDGFVRAMSEHDLPIYPNTILAVGQIHETDEAVFRKNTAWICTSLGDTVTLSAHLRKLNLRIPEDVSLIGTDELPDKNIPGTSVGLTVCRPDYLELSNNLRKLLDLELSIAPGSVSFCPMKLIPRDSVAPCRTVKPNT